MEAVLGEFRGKKLEEVESTGQYRRKLDYLQTYLEDEADIESTEDLTSEDVEQYDTWRKYESLPRDEPLADTTLSDDMYLFREFVQYLIEHRMAPVRFEKCVEIPEIDYAGGEGVDKKKLDPEIAKAALNYLRKYKYADIEHVSMEFMCQSGPRKSGLIGRDVPDFDYEERVLKYETEETTPLKNDESSEREITLYGDVPEIIRDYLEDQRPPVTDEEGREPLLTKGDGRMSPSTLQKIAYKWTRPCMVGLDCPHDRNPEDCEAAQKNNSAYKCPSSRAPHHIRTGYITDQKNRGVSADGIEQRCDVTPRVQKLHYDHPDDAEDRERFEDEFRNADDDPDSGFNHN
jgi:site-specific recombinase XerC